MLQGASAAIVLRAFRVLQDIEPVVIKEGTPTTASANTYGTNVVAPAAGGSLSVALPGQVVAGLACVHLMCCKASFKASLKVMVYDSGSDTTFGSFSLACLGSSMLQYVPGL